MLRNFFTFSRFTLFIALCISAIAAWYSVIGLTAIFAGAVIPIIIMGGILEVAKITTTVWLHRYWDRASYAIRTYLTIAVVALACLTSMGIFGLLSKAHLEQGVISGEVQSSVALLDEKIKISKENIDANRKALRQLDEAVDQVMARSTTETGADKAVQIRRSQARERTRLLQEIEAEQKKISAYNEQRAPVASQLRKVEAEVGPIKYIAALVYGDNPDTTTLERAVRWVTILIVAVFDPLAIVLILAANNSLRWEQEDRLRRQNEGITPVVSMEPETKGDEQQPENEVPQELEQEKHPESTEIIHLNGNGVEDKAEELFSPDMTPASTSNQKVLEPENVETNVETSDNVDKAEAVIQVEQEQPETKQPGNVETVAVQQPITEKEIVTEGVTKKSDLLHPNDSEYFTYNGKSISAVAMRELHPQLFLRENDPVNEILYGPKFPEVSRIGDMYIRTDFIPNRVFKFNGVKWIEVDKKNTTTYLQNVNYVQFLISKLDSGEYDPELLTPAEQDEISDYLNRAT